MNSKKITIGPITRIEGHGKVTIQLDEKGEVEQARFHVVEFRGFEKFCEGRLFSEMPSITMRICGICPVSHQLASAKACDGVAGVEIPPTAKLLRELLQHAQYVQSHSMHFFHLAGPDLLLGFDADPAIRNVVGIIAANPEVATKAVLLRKFGQDIIAVLGEKKVHPSFSIPGGVNKALQTEARDKILGQLEGVIKDIQLGIDILKGYVAKNSDLWFKKVKSFASFPSMYMGTVDAKGNLELYDGTIRLKDSKGAIVEDRVKPKDYLSIIEERVEDWSYMKFPHYRKLHYPKGMYRVGPLARLNVADGISTPLANKEFQNFKNLGTNGIVEGSMFYHYARLIEDLYAAEKIGEILADDRICSTDIYATGKFTGEGVGVVEAPRGTLIHHYVADESGAIRKVNLIVATGHNNAAMNMAVGEVARAFVKGDKLTEGVLNRVEAAIRCYDPCLSCATHALGKMPLAIQLVSHAGVVLDSVAT